MTWKEFVVEVNKQIVEKKISADAQIDYLDISGLYIGAEDIEVTYEEKTGIKIL